jgi:hypothetical protein
MAEADSLIVHLMDVMDALLAIVTEETAQVRAGKLSAARKLEVSKTELSQLYVTGSARLQASQSYLAQMAPGILAAFRKRHELFQAVLQMNLTVLATAHAVSEGIIRGVSAELARKAMPAGYGASGRSALPQRHHAQPLALSRML